VVIRPKRHNKKQLVQLNALQLLTKPGFSEQPAFSKSHFYLASFGFFAGIHFSHNKGRLSLFGGSNSESLRIIR